MRTGVEQTRSQKEKAQREESKGDESPPPDAPRALDSFASVADGGRINHDLGWDTVVPADAARIAIAVLEISRAE